jgi:hypothetical protein
LSWQPSRVACRIEFINAMAGHDLRLVQVYIELFNASDNVTLSLAKGELKSVGQLNERLRETRQVYLNKRQEVYNVLNSAVREVNMLEYQRRASAEMQEQQRRSAAAQILLNNWSNTQGQLQQQQNPYLQNLMSLPTTTNCYVIGNAITCTTR